MESAPHIAVVDDHRDIRELVGRYLMEHGYRVSAADGAAALRRLQERSALRTVATAWANCLLRSPLVRQASPIANGRPARSVRWSRTAGSAPCNVIFPSSTLCADPWKQCKEEPCNLLNRNSKGAISTGL